LQSGLTARLRQATFSSFCVSTANQTAFQMCQAYAERWPAPLGTSEGSGLLLWGIPGVGKTHLVAALANRILERGARVRFCNVTQWLNRLRDEMREEDPVEERMEDLGNADLLVLDDLGAQKSTAWALEKIYQVVNQRYEGLQPLVVTTNKNLNQLERGVGSRIFGRLLEICAPAEVKGEDWRMKIARERQLRATSDELTAVASCELRVSSEEQSERQRELRVTVSSVEFRV
jgi:DNA replication protein DnaC